MLTISMISIRSPKYRESFLAKTKVYQASIELIEYKILLFTSVYFGNQGNIGGKFIRESLHQEHLNQSTQILTAGLFSFKKDKIQRTWKQHIVYCHPYKGLNYNLQNFTWNRLSRPCFVLPPAESPSTMNISAKEKIWNSNPNKTFQ